MIQFGYKIMTEEHGPKELVENARMAEDAGFDFVSISDHFHPWLEAQGHSPFAWSVLGAIAHATSKIAITTGLTCPIIRYHPAIIAQAAATTFHEYYLLAVVGYIAHKFTCFAIVNYCTTRNLD